jgi:hypothetical protein
MSQKLYAAEELTILGKEIARGAEIPAWVPKDRIERGLQSGRIRTKPLGGATVAPAAATAPVAPAAPAPATAKPADGKPAEGKKV